jgi:hypothetical protein
MDVDTNHLVADINEVPVEKRDKYSSMPRNMRRHAMKELNGKSQAFVDPGLRSPLALWAQNKRKQKAKAKIAKASRKRNRSTA